MLLLAVLIFLFICFYCVCLSILDWVLIDALILLIYFMNRRLHNNGWKASWIPLLGCVYNLIYLRVILKQSLKNLKNFSVINLDSCCLIECLCLGASVSLWFGFHESVKKKFKRKDYSINWRVCNSQIMIHMKLKLSKISNY